MIINYFDDIDRLFLTLTIIVSVTYLVYKIAQHFNRPLVLAGLFAGVIINHLHLPAKYFDISSCSGLGNIGIALFMMMLGSEFNFAAVKERKRDILISIISIAIPFSCGYLIAPVILKFDPIPSTIIAHNLFLFRMFVGISISMTAFAILSMFVSHTNLMNSKIGNLAILCGSVDEFIFWVLLALILVFFQENAVLKSYAVVGLIVYILTMIFIMPQLIHLIANRIKSTKAMLGFMIVGCFFFAVIADIVNLHTIFGAFIFGIMLPRNNYYIRKAKGKIADVLTLILLPIYFVASGMYTSFSFFLNPNVLLLGVAIAAIAIFGKFGGAFLTGRLLGYSRIEAALLGSLLNMRGVIEIVVLNLGLELHVISQNIFSMLIAMTILSNFLATSICLKISSFIQKKKYFAIDQVTTEKNFPPNKLL